MPLRQLTDEDFSIARNSTIFFGYSFLYSRFYKRYTDTKAESGDFYENWYVSPERSYDSIFESLLSNRLFVQIQPWDRDGAVGVINAGIGNDAPITTSSACRTTWVRTRERIATAPMSTVP